LLSQLVTWPAPASEIPSPDFTVEVDGCPVFVYQARVRAEILPNDGLWTHQRDCRGERASFAIFDIAAPVTVTVRPARDFHAATVLPARAGIATETTTAEVRFTVTHPRQLTVILDGSDAALLHLFIGTPETDVPRADDPDVIYFAPGLHEIDGLTIPSGKTVYLAGGAVVKAALPSGETGTYSEKWKVTFYNGSGLTVTQAKGVRICGRGILDGSLIPHPGWTLVNISQSEDVRLSGIVLRDSANWDVIINQSRRVEVDDLRIISGRLNSDGINSVNSQQVHIHDCFVRNHDDSIVVKATAPAPASEDILVEDCVIWNDWGYALGATYETRAPIRRVQFQRCDILFASHQCLGVRVGDRATVSEITFRDITVSPLVPAPHRGGERAYIPSEPWLIQLIIVNDCFSTDAEVGCIRDITVDGLTQAGDHLLASEIIGVDTEHDVQNVILRNIRLHGHPPVTTADELRLRIGEFVSVVRIEG